MDLKNITKVILSFILFHVFMFFGLSSCSKENRVKEKLEIDADAFYVDKDHSGSSDGNDGRYIEDGGTGPWETIQHAIDVVQPGQRVYVRQSNQPYFENERKSTTDYSGNTFTHGGTDEDNRIYVEGYPGERPVIDIDRQLGSELGKPVCGFYIHQGDYITIKNFEITRTTASGILTNPGGQNDYINIENNHIHHIYGGDNTGAIRLDFSDHCIVRNNILHNIYNVRPEYTSNPFDSEPHGLHSGIHGYQPANCIIENNLIHNVEFGVFQKQADVDHGNSHMVRRNIFHTVNKHAYTLQIQGAGLVAPRNAEFFENLVYDTENAVAVILQDVGEQGDGIKVYNNTLFNTESIGTFEEMLNIEIFNNIVVGNKPGWSTSSSEAIIFSTLQTIDKRSYRNEIAYFDHNLYFGRNYTWILERYGTHVKVVRDLQNWQATIDTALGLNFQPDQSSFIADPLFENENMMNFNLRANSAARTSGRGGSYPGVMGAYRDGIKIGPDWTP